MGLMKKLTSAVVASSLVLGLVGTAAADFSPAGVNAAAARMQALNVVKGVLQPDGTTDLMLGKNITRAELVTIIVRAFGQSETAKIVKGYPAFTDSGDHWASGEIAVAKNVIESKGHTLGVTATTFVPNKDVTAGEAIAFLMKFLGIKADSTQSWPMDYINGAVQAGLITEADKTALTVSPNTPATRGLVFYFADQAFGEYKNADGKNVYNTYVDTQAPVVTVDSFEANTTATEVTLTGTASGQSVLHVGSTQNIVTVGADGKWSTTVKLELGENDIWVHALDAAGNAGVPASAVKITRSAGAAATVEATVPATIVAGESFELSAKAFDANKAEVAGAEFEVTVEGNIGTYDAATGKFTAATTVGTGKLTIKSGEATTTADLAVVAGALDQVTASKLSAAPGEKITLIAKDAKGNVISSGVTYTQTSADALVDSTNGSFIASKAGNYTVTATANGVSKTVTIGVFSSTVAKYNITASASSVIANNASTFDITVQAVDANGNVITTNEDTNVAVDLTGFLYKDSTGAFVAAPATVNLKGGVKTLTLRTGNLVGGQVRTITAGAAEKLSQAKVELLDQVATSVTVSNSDTFLANNSGTETATFTVSVKDQAGKKMLSGAWAVKVTVDGPAAIQGASSDGSRTVTWVAGAAEPTVTVQSKKNLAGTITVSAAAAGLTAGTDSVTAQAAGEAAKVVASINANSAAEGVAGVDTLVIDLQITDAAGVPVNTNPTTLVAEFAITDTQQTNNVVTAAHGANALGNLSNKQLSLNGAFTSGKASLKVAASAFTGDLVVTIKDTDGDLATATQTLKYGADTYARIALTGGAVAVPAAQPTSTFTVQLKDANNNNVAKADVELLVKAYTGFNATTGAFSGQVTDVTVNGAKMTTDGIKVKTDATGKATFEVTVPGYVTTGNRFFQVTGRNSANTADLVNSAATGNAFLSASVSVVNYVAGTITADVVNFGATTSATTVNAGDRVTVRAFIKDTQGTAMAGGQTVKLYMAEGTAYTLDGANAVTATKVGSSGIAMTYNATSGAYEVSVAPGTAGRVAFTVKDETSATPISASAAVGGRSVQITKDNAAHAFKLKFDGYTSSGLDLTKGSVTAYTISVTDNYGNPVVAPYDVTVNFAAYAGAVTVDTGATASTFLRTSETGINKTSVTIKAGSSSTTVYLVTDVAASSQFSVKLSGTTNYVDPADVVDQKGDLTIGAQYYTFNSK